MKVVLDTNILVSALLTPEGVSGQVLDLFRKSLLTLLLDERILGEYRTVLARPRFGFETGVVDELLAFLDRFGMHVIANPLGFSIPDPTDVPFLEVALSGGAEVLVTGNKRDYGRPPKGLKILNPAEFLALYRKTPQV